MYRYYLTIDMDTNNNDTKTNDTPQQTTMSPKIRLATKSSDPKPVYSPKTLKKNISNENFIKYQWPWVI